MRARGRLRRLALATSVAAAASVAVASAAPRPAPIAVSLTADEAAPQGGDAVQIGARLKRLPRGDLIVIRVVDSGGIADTVATCSGAPCRGYWTEADAATATFQAFVRTRPKGGRIVGKSAPLRLAWSAPAPQPPPPPPPPAVLPGHYCGLSNEGKSVCFDVAGTPGSESIQNLRLESNVVCGDGSGWWWWLEPGSAVALDPTKLSFALEHDGALTASASATNIAATYTIQGTLDTAGNVSGTVWLQHISWDQDGKHYDCAGDPRTWTARLGA